MLLGIAASQSIVIDKTDGDPYWANVVHLLNFEGTPESTIFTDKAGASWAPAGSAKIVSDGASFGGTAGLFNGSGSLETPFSFDRTLGGAKSFTIEMFVTPIQLTTYQSLIGAWQSDENGIFRLLADSSGRLRFDIRSQYSTISTPWSASGVLINGVRSYVSVRWTGTKYEVWCDGLIVTSLKTTVAPHPNASSLSIGRNIEANTWYANARIDEVRITRGVARDVYSIPTKQFPDYYSQPSGDDDIYWDRVISSINFDGADTTTKFIDKKGFAWSPAGDVHISSGTAVFDGSGDYIWITGNTDFNLGIEDFTIEFEVKTVQTGEKVLVDYYYTGKRTWQLNVRNGKFVMYVGSPLHGYPLQGTKIINDGLPHTVCAERKNGVLRFYVDGVLDGEAPLTYNFDWTTEKFAIGTQVAIRNTGYDFSGTINNFRLTKGVARYTEGPVLSPVDAYWGNVSSLHHFNDSSLTDETGRNWTMTGNVQLRDSEKLFGEKSAYFDVVSYLSSAPSTDWAFGTGDFTVEFWMRLDAIGYYASVVGNWNGSSGWAFNITPDGGAVFYMNGSYLNFPAPALLPNTPYRIAVTRASGVTRMFVNGVNVVSQTLNTDLSSTAGVNIGNSRAVDHKFRGYIDELRITKGFARYTADYSLATLEFYSGTKFKKSFVMNGNQYFSQPLEGTINGPATMFIDFIPYVLPPTSGSFDNLITLIRHSSILNAAPFLNMSPSNITYNGIGMIRNAEPVQLYSIYPRGDLKVGERYRVFFVIPSGATSSVLGVIKSFVNGSLKLSTADYAFPRPNIIGGTHVAGRAGLDGELVAFGICGSSLSDSTVAEIASNPAYDFTTLPNLVDLWFGGDYSAGTIPNKVSGRPALTLVNK